MRKFIALSLSLMATFLCTILTFDVVAQETSAESFDVVVMLDGEERKGKVKGITDDLIKFVYAGEDLQYEFKKSDINKITFSSGRTQTFNEAVSDNEMATTAALSAAERKGIVAVLPFTVVTNDPGIMTEELGLLVQTECASIISEEARMLTVQSTRTTNANLAKLGITDLNTVDPSELAAMIGAEFVVFGTFDVMHDGTHSYGSDVTTEKTKRDDGKKKQTTVSSGSSSTSIDYDSKVHLEIYNDQGQAVFTDAKEPFSGGPDSYGGPIKRIIRHSPWGSKG